MRYGHKAQLDKWMNSGQSPEKVASIVNQLQWINQDWWYLAEPGDGELEAAKLETLKATLKGKTAATSIPVQQPASLTINNKPVPPVKKAPGLLGKAVQMFKTVSGPLVKESVFQSRLSKCTREGGLTFSPVRGIVKAIGPRFVQIDALVLQLPSDETPDVEIGQSIEVGQPIAKSNNAKPCPYLKTKQSSTGEQLWCRSCGCGEKTIAELHNKLRYARLVCPRNYPLFTAEDDPNSNPTPKSK